MIFIIIKNSNNFWVEESKAGRFYCRKDKSGQVLKYPSVTTISSSGGKKYSSGSSPAMSMGTLVHYHILRKYTTNKLTLPTEHIWNTPRSEVVGRVRRCLNMWEELKLPIKPICVETAVFNTEDVLYAGRIDMLARLNNEVTLIDIKTGAHYDDHIIQASAYWNALNRKPKVAFIYLDGIIDRNPSQLANIQYFSESDLEAGYEIFLDKYVDFK